MITQPTQLQLFDPDERPTFPSRYFITALCTRCGQLCPHEWGLDASGERWERSTRCACSAAEQRLREAA